MTDFFNTDSLGLALNKDWLVLGNFGLES